MQSTDVADDEQRFFRPDEQLETEEDTLQRKQTAKQQAQTAKQNENTSNNTRSHHNPNKQTFLFSTGA